MRLALAVATIALITAYSSRGVAQEIEYGDRSELKGVMVIFIDSRLDTEFRDHAIVTLKRELPEVVVAKKKDDARVVLHVTLEGSDSKHGSATVLVVGPSSNPNAIHVIAKYEDTKTSIFTPKLSTILMKRFARDWRDANR